MQFRQLEYKGALYRLSSGSFSILKQTIKDTRKEIEEYIETHPGFKTALTPLSMDQDASETVRLMLEGAHATGVGPMAAVAGTIAYKAVESARMSGHNPVLVENGGDICLYNPDKPVTLAIWAGKSPLSDRLAFILPPRSETYAVCSSSSRMGHSLSFGDCDLCSVFSHSGSLADCAATWGANQVKSTEDIEPVLGKLAAIPGVDGALIIREQHIGMIGDLPEIIKNSDPRYKDKITFHKQSNFHP